MQIQALVEIRKEIEVLRSVAVPVDERKCPQLLYWELAIRKRDTLLESFRIRSKVYSSRD